jgi:hypothetical protein
VAIAARARGVELLDHDGFLTRRGVRLQCTSTDSTPTNSAEPGALREIPELS